MITTTGLNPNFYTVIKDLITLDFDAAEAYHSAIERIEDPEIRKNLTEFREDHLRHIRELSAVARELGLEPPTGPDMKAALTRGKVIIADMFGDKAILMAMKTNEEDTNTAYERAFHHKNLEMQVQDLIATGLADERRHRAWIIDRLKEISDKAA